MIEIGFDSCRFVADNRPQFPAFEMDTDQPSSMLHVRPSSLYPLPESCHTPPFNVLCGEAVRYKGSCADGVLALTNYRLYIQNGDRQNHVPLGLIEIVEVRDMFYLHIGCKDARSYRCTFDNNEQCGEWFRRILDATTAPRQLEDLFAFCFKAWAAEGGGEDVTARLENDYGFEENSFDNEVRFVSFRNGAFFFKRLIPGETVKFRTERRVADQLDERQVPPLPELPAAAARPVLHHRREAGSGREVSQLAENTGRRVAAQRQRGGDRAEQPAGGRVAGLAVAGGRGAAEGDRERLLFRSGAALGDGRQREQFRVDAALADGIDREGEHVGASQSSATKGTRRRRRNLHGN